MTDNVNESNEAELASFRQQWQAEVAQRTTRSSQTQQPTAATSPPHSRTRPVYTSLPTAAAASSSSVPHQPDFEPSFSTAGISFEGSLAGRGREKEKEWSRKKRREKEVEGGSRLVTALEHFEKAMEKEGEGLLGPSLELYRKAYRMDPRIDTKYREKYFLHAGAATSSASTSSSKPTAPATVPQPIESTGHTSAVHSPLILSFTNCRIHAQPTPRFSGNDKDPQLLQSTKGGITVVVNLDGTTTETDPEPEQGFSLLARLPYELLLHVLHYVAYTDLAELSRVAQVCKSLAFIVATEETLWKEACYHPKWGFPCQVYDWKCTLLGKPLPQTLEPEELDIIQHLENLTLSDSPITSSLDLTTTAGNFPEFLTPPPLRLTWNPASLSLPLPYHHDSYYHLFSHHPRIRYNGIYISTCNYIRPGAAHSTYNALTPAPIHIVTYYRYLRFYPNGTAITLLTTHEPIDVVYVFHPSLYKGQTWAKDVRRGRWRISPPNPPTRVSHPDGARDTWNDGIGELEVETEGVPSDRYEFRMALKVVTSGRRQRANKLLWRSYWAWNRLTDDMAEFGLRNDKPFFWGRVGSYGREVVDGMIEAGGVGGGVGSGGGKGKGIGTGKEAGGAAREQPGRGSFIVG